MPLNKNIYFLIGATCITSIYNIFFGTFLISFLFTQTKENVADIGIFQILCYLTVGTLAYLTGDWIKRGNRLLMYQLGIIVTFLFFVAFLFLQHNIVNYIPLCGIIFGLIISFKAFPYNLIVADNIPASQMIAFRGYFESLKNILKLVTPFILGVFLTNIPYFQTVAFLATLSVLEFILISKIKVKPQKQLLRFNLWKFWKQTKRQPFLKQLYQIELCRGMTVDGTLKTIITLYIVYLFKTDFNLGMISSLFYGLTIILSFVFGHNCYYTHFVKILTLTTMLALLSLITFVFWPTRATFIFYNFGFVMAMQFLLIIADINMFNISNLPQIVSKKNEYFVVRELFLNIGRLISYTALLTVGFYGDFNMLKYLLMFFTLFLIVMSWNCIKLNHYFMKQK